VADKDKFLEELEAARLNPSSPLARKLLREVDCFLTLAGGTVPGSAGERKAELPKLYANTRFFGPATVFDSCSPDDVHDPRAMRLACPSRGPGCFPDDATLFLAALRRENHASSEEHDAAMAAFMAELGPDRVFPFEEAGQQQLATDNPVATVLAFESLKEAFFKDLLAVPPETTYRATTNPHGRPKGVHGRGFGFGSVEETNKRKSKHWHTLLHAGGHADLLAACLCDPVLREELHRALDSIYIAEAPAALHALDVARKELKVRGVRHGVYEPPTYPVDDSDDRHTIARKRLDFDRAAFAVAVSVGTHDHRHRCHGGKPGKLGCAMSRPAGHQVPQTRAVVLRLDNDKVRS
jgi:hypothetical protein